MTLVEQSDSPTAAASPRSSRVSPREGVNGEPQKVVTSLPCFGSPSKRRPSAPLVTLHTLDEASPATSNRGEFKTASMPQIPASALEDIQSDASAPASPSGMPAQLVVEQLRWLESSEGQNSPPFGGSRCIPREAVVRDTLPRLDSMHRMLTGLNDLPAQMRALHEDVKCMSALLRVVASMEEKEACAADHGRSNEMRSRTKAVVDAIRGDRGASRSNTALSSNSSGSDKRDVMASPRHRLPETCRTVRALSEMTSVRDCGNDDASNGFHSENGVSPRMERRPSNLSNGSYVQSRRPSTHSVYSNAMSCVLPNLVEDTHTSEDDKSEFDSSAGDADASPQAKCYAKVVQEQSFTRTASLGTRQSIARRARTVSLSSLLPNEECTSQLTKSGYFSLISPTSKPRVAWDVLVVAAGIMVGFVIPAVMVYTDTRRSLAEGTPGYIALSVADILFVLDVVATLSTATLLDDASTLTSWRTVASLYMQSWFLVDLLSAWPLAFSCYLQLDTMLTVLVTTKLLRVLKLRSQMHRLEVSAGGVQWATLKLVLASALSIHWLSCSWRLVLHFDELRDSTATLDLWYELYVSDVYFFMATVTSVGYGDITPSGTAGKIFCSLCMGLGAGLCGFVITTIAEFMKRLLYDNIAMQVRQARTFMQSRGVPRQLQRRVEINLRQKLEQELNIATSMLLGKLSGTLQRDLSMELLRNVVLHFPIFGEAPRAFVAELAQAHRWITSAPGDIVVEEGRVVEDLVFVVRGSLIVLESDGSKEDESTAIVETEVGVGAWIGERAIFDSDLVHTCTAVATANAELALLPIAEFHRIARGYPQIDRLLAQIVQAIGDGVFTWDAIKYNPRMDFGRLGPLGMMWRRRRPSLLVPAMAANMASDLETQSVGAS
eukprot:TRINITY_DN258_c0_g1_i1.p1 TRINITY_DN258_c0_g1~~TRINITY_DN258_c0_g1_i1.p1  ORF type:complete len:939 (+),score=131.55 TRINITY_DN258_c0_g1_i1:146-2818(+)